MFRKDEKVKKIVLSLKTMNDYKHNNNLDMSTKRNIVRICFIDDEGYPHIDKLRSIGFNNVDVKYNFDKIEDYKDYDLIFCDLDGVGKHLDAIAQGLCIAEQLKDNYPNSEVFIFSGNIIDEYGTLPENIKYIPKQTSIKELAKIIDKACEDLWDPVKAWNRIHMKMLKENIPCKMIALLEDEYVRSLECGINNFSSKKSFNLSVENIHNYVNILLTLTDIILRVVGK